MEAVGAPFGRYWQRRLVTLRDQKWKWLFAAPV